MSSGKLALLHIKHTILQTDFIFSPPNSSWKIGPLGKNLRNIAYVIIHKILLTDVTLCSCPRHQTTSPVPVFFTLWRRVSKCCGSVTFWYGSRDPCLWPLDPDPEPAPAIFVQDLQDANKKQFFLCFYAYYFLMVHLHRFSKIESHREVTKQ